MRLIVPCATARGAKIHGRSHASRERKRSSDRRRSFRASCLVSRPTISATPRVSARYSAAPSRAVRRNDFNEAASITSVNRARALTGDLRPVGRACASIQRGERHRVPPREAIDKARLTSIVHSAASGNCQGDYREMRLGMLGKEKKKDKLENKKQDSKLETLSLSLPLSLSFFFQVRQIEFYHLFWLHMLILLYYIIFRIYLLPWDN